MKKLFVFLAVFTLSLLADSAFSLNPSHEGKRVIALRIVSEEIAGRNASVQEFFQSLDGGEQRLFNAILQGNYSAGYYSELLRFSDPSHRANIEGVLVQVEGHLFTLRDGKYDAILARADANVVQFIVGRREVGALRGRTVGYKKWVYGTTPDLAVHLNIDRQHYWGGLFFGAVYTPPIKGTQYYLRAEEVFPISAHEMTLKPLPSRQVKKSRRFELDLNRADVGKVLFSSLLLLLAMAVVILLIGAQKLSHLPVFRRVRLLFDY